MKDLFNWVVENVVRKRIARRVNVPNDWIDKKETLYGRVKSDREFTAFHCDALNTIVRRRLVPRESDDDPFLASELPVYTVWIALCDMTHNHSQLRMHPGSHVLDDIEIKRHKTSKKPLRVVPQGYRYDSEKFLAPRRPYRAGDVVVFHCLTQHDATVHIERPLDVEGAVRECAFEALIGTEVHKRFSTGLFRGTIVSVDDEDEEDATIIPEKKLVHVVYEDGDEEDLTTGELLKLLKCNSKPKAKKMRTKKAKLDNAPLESHSRRNWRENWFSSKRVSMDGRIRLDIF
eukprot:g4002.t1